MNLRFRLANFGYWVGWNVLWLIPNFATRKLFQTAAFLAWKFEIKSVKQLELNLSRVLDLLPSDPRVKLLGKQAMASYMRYYFETFSLPRWSDEKLFGSVRVTNVEPILEAVKTGGVILTLPHSGNWDHAGAFAAKYFGSLCTVAERLRPEGVFQKFLKMRSDRGITIKALTGEGGTYEYLKENLLNGKVVALLGDRDVAGNGMTNNFFSHKATIPIGAAVLAIDTGRPLFTCACWYDGEKLVIDFDSEITFEKTTVSGRERLRKAQEITSIIAKRFEKHISAHPNNWHQLQPIWNDLKV